MPDNTEQAGCQAGHMVTGQQLGNEAGKHGFQGIPGECDQAEFPAHGPLDIAGSGISAADLPEIGTAGKPGDNQPE